MRIRLVFFTTILFIVTFLILLSCAGAESPEYQAGSTISGVVHDASGPVSGATVRVQATSNAVITDTKGRFTLTGLIEGEAVTVSASIG
jgi:hypothetical protein